MEAPPLDELRRGQRVVVQARLDSFGHWIQHEAADRLNAELLKILDTVAPC